MTDIFDELDDMERRRWDSRDGYRTDVPRLITALRAERSRAETAERLRDEWRETAHANWFRAERPEAALQDAAATLTPVGGETGWQPIETYKPHGDLVLGYVPHDGGDGWIGVIYGTDEHNPPMIDWYEDGGASMKSATGGRGYLPTHWQPLPAPPAATPPHVEAAHDPMQYERDCWEARGGEGWPALSTPTPSTARDLMQDIRDAEPALARDIARDFARMRAEGRDYPIAGSLPDVPAPRVSDPVLHALICRAIDAYSAMTPAERKAHDEAQRASLVRGLLPEDHGRSVTPPGPVAAARDRVVREARAWGNADGWAAESSALARLADAVNEMDAALSAQKETDR